MFIPEKKGISTKFISCAEYGTLSLNPHVHYYRVSFVKDFFTDLCFYQHKMILPAQFEDVAKKRKAEYFAGRYCCAELLRHFDLPTHVGQYPDGSPCWPSGITGSISHCDNQAIAVITRQKNCCVGIDIEIFNRANLRDCADIITLEEERKNFKTLLLDSDRLLLLAFSAKESLFKALYPSVQYLFGFEYASLHSVDTDRGRFSLILNKDINPIYQAGLSITGHYRFDGDTLTTLVFLASIPSI